MEPEIKQAQQELTEREYLAHLAEDQGVGNEEAQLRDLNDLRVQGEFELNACSFLKLFGYPMPPMTQKLLQKLRRKQQKKHMRASKGSKEAMEVIQEDMLALETKYIDEVVGSKKYIPT